MPVGGAGCARAVAAMVTSRAVAVNTDTRLYRDPGRLIGDSQNLGLGVRSGGQLTSS